MTREALLQQTIERLSKLPEQKLQEVNDFAEFLLSRIDEQLLTQGISKMTGESDAFKFLESEPDLYSVKDLKERYK
jgi:hypothetical protein